MAPHENGFKDSVKIEEEVKGGGGRTLGHDLF